MKYKALIFDMDGTLLDTLSGILRACNETFSMYGYKVSFTKEDGKYFIGAGTNEFAKRAMTRASIEGLDFEKFMHLFHSNYGVYQKSETKAFPGLEELLIKLKEKGYLIGICSNKPQDLLNEVVASFYPNTTFDVVVGQVDSIPSKPQPDMMRLVKDRIKLEDKDILYIGDSEYDYEFANNCHVDSCIVTYGYGMYTKEFINHVTYKANSVGELEKLLLE